MTIRWTTWTARPKIPSLPGYQTGTPPPAVKKKSDFGIRWKVLDVRDFKQFQTVAAKDAIDATSREPSQIQVGGYGVTLGPLYGRCSPSVAAIYAVVTSGENLIVGVAWGVGEIDSVEAAYINGEALPAGVTATHYLGTTTQAADSTLASAIPGYSDELIYTVKGQKIGVVHSVFTVPPGIITGFPRFSVIVKGRKIYDPRGPSTAYSTNPSLVLSDFLSNDIYGAGMDVDMTSVGASATKNDETLASGAKRREIGLAIDRAASSASWAETLRAYAGCFVVPRGGTIYLVPNAATASSRTFTAEDVVSDAGFTMAKRSARNVPTVVTVEYTDASKVPWRAARAPFYAEGAITGTSRYDESVIRLAGIQSHEQAYREAKERIQLLTLSDLTVECTVFDEAMAQELGDVITISHPRGLTSKEMRITDITPDGTGNYRLRLAEYVAAAYSDDEVPLTSPPDTTLGSPLSPPDMGAISLTEEVFQKSDGIYASRVRASWSSVSYPYVRHYEAQMLVGALVIWSGNTTDAEIPTAPVVQENVTHTLRVRVVSTSGAVGGWSSGTITPLGNQLPPSDLTRLTVIEVGGEVRAWWDQSIDIGVVRYAIRYGTVATAWSALSNFDMVDALAWVTKNIPPGTWRIWVCPIDNVGNYASNPLYRDLEVTSDVDAFFVGDHDFWDDAPVLSNVYEWSMQKSAVTDYFSYLSTDTISGTFPNALDTYTNPAITYHSSVSSSITSVAHDYGAIYQGTFRGSADADAISGSTIGMELGLSEAGSVYTWGELSINDSARYAKVRVTSATTNTFHFSSAENFDVRLDVVARAERGIATTSTGGTVQVDLEGTYQFVKSLVVSPGGSANEITARWDDIQIQAASPNNFDIYSYVSGSLASGVEVSWEFKGV